jgi:hypothetical protein
VVIESEPPFAVSVLGLAPSALAFGHEKVQWAIETWRRCMKSGVWPGYPTRSLRELPRGRRRAGPKSASSSARAPRSRWHERPVQARQAGERAAADQCRRRHRQREDVQRAAAGVRNRRRRAFAVIDTENGRARHYADQFAFDVADLHAPFTPLAYQEAIVAAAAAGYPVVVVDSMSHEHAGDGGLLDMQEAELERMAGDDRASSRA